MKKEWIDERICDKENCDNTQTYREFIKESEDWFGLEKANLEKMGEEDLNDYINFLDYLWEK